MDSQDQEAGVATYARSNDHWSEESRLVISVVYNV